MPKHLEGHIVKATTRDNPKTNRDNAEGLGGKLSLSGNANIATQGGIVTGKYTSLKGKVTADQNAIIAAHTAKTELHDDNKDTVSKMNAAFVVIEQELPGSVEGNYAKWEAFGCKITMIEVPDQTIPGEVLHGAMSQGDFLGFANVIHDGVERADFFTIRMTKGNPALDAGYSLITLPTPSFTSNSVTIPIPPDYWGVDLFFKITAHNSAGPGPESAPVGGRKINGQS